METEALHPLLAISYGHGRREIQAANRNSNLHLEYMTRIICSFEKGTGVVCRIYQEHFYSQHFRKIRTSVRAETGFFVAFHV